MNDRFELKAVLSANAASLISALKAVEAPAQAARKYLTDIAKSAGGLGAKFGLPVGLASGLAAGFGVAKIKAAVGAYAELGDAVHHGATRAGMSVENFQRLKYVAEQSGVEAERMEGAMGKLNLALGKAAGGRAKDVTALLQRLGIGMRDASGLIRSGMDVLPELADAFVRNENPALRARMGMALFGKTWQEMVPILETGSEGLAEAQARMSKFKGVMSAADIERSREFAKSLRDLDLVSKSFQMTIAKALVPAIQPLLDGFNEWMAANKKLVSADVGKTAKQLGSWLASIDWRGMAKGVRDFGQAVGKLVDFAGGSRNALIALAVVINAQTLMATASLAGAVWRAGAAFVGMAARAYVAGNASMLSMLRVSSAMTLLGGPIGRLRALWMVLGTTTVSMSGLMSGAMALVTGGIRAIGVALMANPLGIILAIASAAWLIYENWDTVKGWFASFWTWMKAHADLILTCLGPIGWIAKVVITHWEPIKAWFGAFVGWLSDKLHWIIDKAHVIGKLMGFGNDSDALPIAAPEEAPRHTDASNSKSLIHGGRGMSLLPPPKAAGRVEGQVNIKIDGLPQGARVEQVAGGNMPLNIDAGYSTQSLRLP